MEKIKSEKNIRLTTIPENAIKTVTYKENFPDAAMTALVNKLGNRFINCEKENGKWTLVYLGQ